jgi:hypothetical protein
MIHGQQNIKYMFMYLNSKNKGRGTLHWNLKYLLDLWTFVVEKLPDDGTLVPKHVGVGTWYEVRFVMCFILF